MSYKSNIKKLKSLNQLAFHKTADRFSDSLDESIEADVYEWDRITHRKSGEIVGTPRNVVDTGYLKDTRYEVSQVGSREYIYPADYAQEALEEHLTGEGKNWIEVTIDSHNWAEVYREEWKKLA